MNGVLKEEEKSTTGGSLTVASVPRSYAVVGGFDTGSILEKYLPKGYGQLGEGQKESFASTSSAAESNVYSLSLVNTTQVLPASSSDSAERLHRDGGWNSPLITARITSSMTARDIAGKNNEDCPVSTASSACSDNYRVKKILFCVETGEEKDGVAKDKYEDQSDITIKRGMDHMTLINTAGSIEQENNSLEEMDYAKHKFDDHNNVTRNSAHHKTVQFDKAAVASALSSPPLMARHRKQQQSGKPLFLQEARDPQGQARVFSNGSTDTTLVRYSSSAHRAKKMWQTRTMKYVDSTCTSTTYESLADSLMSDNECAIINTETTSTHTILDDGGILKEKSVAAKVAVAGTVAARKFENMYGKHLSSSHAASQNNDDDEMKNLLSTVEGDLTSVTNEEKESLISWLHTIMLDDCPSSLYPIHMTRTVVDTMIQYVSSQVQVHLKQIPLDNNILFEDREDTLSTTSAVVIINTPTPTKSKHAISNSRTPQTTSTNDTFNSNRADWGSDYDDTPPKQKNNNHNTTKLIRPITAHNVLHVIISFLEWIIDVARHTEVPYPSIVDLLLFDCSSSKGYIVNRLATEELDTYDYYHLFHQVIFSTEDSHVVPLISFFKEACHRPFRKKEEHVMTVMKQISEEKEVRTEAADNSPIQNHRNTTPRTKNSGSQQSTTFLQAYFKPPRSKPSPAEIVLIHRSPHLLLKIHSFLADPVTICRIKQVCKSFNNTIRKNHHAFFKQTVRIGGMREITRPKFWLWITLNKCRREESNIYSKNLGKEQSRSHHLEPWHKQSYSFNESSVHPDRYGWEDIDAIARSKSDSSFYEDDSSWVNMSVSSSCKVNAAANGNTALLLPLKINEKAKAIAKKHPRDDFSLLEHIGREGKWHAIIARDVARAFGTLPPHKTKSCRKKDSIVRALVKMKKELCSHQQQRRLRYCTIDEESRAESLSDGFSSIYDDNDSVESKASIPESELALSGILAQDTREILQQKLAAVLHALAAAYDDVGYCQGVDYVVCHLMRILQDTIVALAKSGRLPSSLYAKCSTIPTVTSSSSSNVVEETLFHVMDCFFSYYNLKHMYWPELRFLKRTCHVFQRLIERKLPVLADHFEHHELNVSLFALGWFQTLFLYIPSMPTATVSF